MTGSGEWWLSRKRKPLAHRTVTSHHTCLSSEILASASLPSGGADATPCSSDGSVLGLATAVVASGSSLVSTSAAACAADACSNCGKRGGGGLLTESSIACLAFPPQVSVDCAILPPPTRMRYVLRALHISQPCRSSAEARRENPNIERRKGQTDRKQCIFSNDDGITL